MFNISPQFSPRDLVYFLGGFLFIGLIAFSMPRSPLNLDALGILAAPFGVALAYIVGYLLQELGSFFQLFKTSLAYRHSKFDAWFARLLIADAADGNYVMLSHDEKVRYQALNMKDATVERIQFLRSICHVSGTSFLIAGLVTLLARLADGGLAGNWQIVMLELCIATFLIARGRLEAMQTQYYIRAAIAAANLKTAKAE